MTRPITILIILLLTLSIHEVKADSWIDPTWKKMIDSSDVIALVQYTTSGEFRAKAEPLKIYKGELSTNEIWISGYSNRYGPIDKMSSGDKFIVFLNLYKPTDRALEYWQEQVKKEPELADYYESLKAGNSYYVWSPTSGDLKVKRKKVQYDLLQTTYYKEQSFYPLNEFEVFLRATTKDVDRDFHRQMISKVKSNMSNEKSAQYLMMLYLSSFQEYNPIFRKWQKVKGLNQIMRWQNSLGEWREKNHGTSLCNFSIMRIAVYKAKLCDSFQIKTLNF